MAEFTPLAVVGTPGFKGDYLESPRTYAGDKWQGIWGFLDGVRGVTDRVEGITGDVAGISDTVTDAKRNIWELKNDKQSAETADFLRKAGFQRGDNLKLYAVAGLAAVAVIVIFAK